MCGCLTFFFLTACLRPVCFAKEFVYEPKTHRRRIVLAEAFCVYKILRNKTWHNKVHKVKSKSSMCESSVLSGCSGGDLIALAG